MEELNIIYRILKYLQKSLDCDEFNPEGISPERLHISRSKWQKLLIMLQDEGYIKGLVYDRTFDEYSPQIEEPVSPVITLEGLEYLSENSTMRKMGRIGKGIKDSIPGA